MVGGIIAAGLSYVGVQLKYKFRYDDTVDVFGINAVSGMVGSLVVGTYKAYHEHKGAAFGNQLVGILVTALWAAVFTFLIVLFLHFATKSWYNTLMRLEPDEEQEGLDSAVHKQRVYYSVSAHSPEADKGDFQRREGNGLRISAGGIFGNGPDENQTPLLNKTGSSYA